MKPLAPEPLPTSPSRPAVRRTAQPSIPSSRPGDSRLSLAPAARVRLQHPDCRRLATAALLVLAAFPGLLAGCDAHDGTAPAQASASAAVTVEPATLEMGDLVPEVPVTKQVRLTNNTASPIVISRAVADCSCTDPSWPEDPIEPGATVETNITMTPGLKQGVVLTKRVTFDVEGGEPVFVTVVGKVGLFIEFAPDLLAGPEDSDAAPPPAEIELRSADGTAFRVVGIDPPIASAKSGDAATQHAVVVDWAKWRDASKPLKLTVTTDHPKAPPLVTIIRRPVPPPPPPAP